MLTPAQIYKGLTGAPDEYRRIASQVLSLQAILKLLHETKEDKARILSDEDKGELERLWKGCLEILEQLQTLIDKFNNVGRQRFARIVNFISAAFADTAELQRQLELQLSLLTSFQIGLVKYAGPSYLTSVCFADTLNNAVAANRESRKHLKQ